MKPASAPEPRSRSDWRTVEAGMKVVTLGLRVKVLVPLLALASASQSTRGLTLYPGRPGVALGAAVMAASVAMAYALFPAAGILGAFLAVWLLGSAGAATFVAALRPTAFVKPICVRCRLLPIIREHEAIHLTGVASEGAVWASMKTRHTASSLSLDGDPTICAFCPIPKRLSER